MKTKTNAQYPPIEERLRNQIAKAESDIKRQRAQLAETECVLATLIELRDATVVCAPRKKSAAARLAQSESSEGSES